MATAGMLAVAPGRLASATPALRVANFSGLYTVEVARIATPLSTDDVARALRGWPGKVAIGGGRYSMGGQVALPDALHLDMRGMNRLLWLNVVQKTARVQAGMRWRDLQDVLDPQDLAVKTMQSYSNFTVGGSVSVNAHGRYVMHGPVGNTVRALQLVLADGSVVEARPDREVELFRAAIGGYGAVGVITEVELDLADNVRIEREMADVSLDGYVAAFESRVRGDPACVLHNADLIPPRFDKPSCVTWRKSAKPLTEARRLVPRGQGYGVERGALWTVSEYPGLRRKVVQPLRAQSHPVTWLNHEASMDVGEVAPVKASKQRYVLQEYFVPRRHFLPFARALGEALVRNKVSAINVSIRHSPADTVALLPWAKEEVFCFVLYHRQETGEAAREEVGRWTRELIELALRHQGRYYLPYQCHATRAQFEAAYPEVAQLRALKDSVDPNNRFSNQLWNQYL